MRKLTCILSMAAMLCCTLVSCVSNKPQVSVNTDGLIVVNGVVTDIVADREDVVTVDADGRVIVNGVKTNYEVKTEEADAVRYSVSVGTKLETLPDAEQRQISECVADCATIMAATYSYEYVSNSAKYYEIPYFAVSDAFVYDFREIDEASMSENSLKIWNYIKETVGYGKTPLMYIELDGYACAYPHHYIPTSFEEAGIINGFFIFADDSFVRLNYARVCHRFYLYQMVDGAKVINCGDQFAEQFTKEDILTFDFEQKLIRLKIEQ